ncbi:MAG: alpha,alpha-trehalase TreA [Ginsengibacter sp.]
MKISLIITLWLTSGISYSQQKANDKLVHNPIKNNTLKSLSSNNFTNVTTPDKIYGTLFKDIQLKKALGDNKTFADAVPKFLPSVILKKYSAQKTNPAFDLKDFVTQNFVLPVSSPVKIPESNSLKEHLEQMWGVLTRNADKKQNYNSLLPLPYPYIVPGGRFREIYYWDSYFTMQGLAVSNRYDLIESMIDNFKYLIDTYGHIPNGNRSYYLSRSQPPYFALMVELLEQRRGKSIYKKYFSALEKEYSWWMNGSDKLRPGEAYKRVVKLSDESILNRNWDDKNAPREESYVQDVQIAKSYKKNDGLAFTNLRAGAESGWDFSSRWFADTMNLNTIETTSILPVDLNCLLYAYENILSKAAAENNNIKKSKYYLQQAEKRKNAILKFFWSEDDKFFFDYHFKNKKTTGRWSMAGAMPLFVNIATRQQANEAIKILEEKFLKAGGLVTTPYETGQQWDWPNGWAPLQFITVTGLVNYQQDTLAKSIAQRWMNINEKVFSATGKMMEKYNVENESLESGGGEYPSQDGFGWSNGVYLKFYDMFRNK